MAWWFKSSVFLQLVPSPQVRPLTTVFNYSSTSLYWALQAWVQIHKDSHLIKEEKNLFK